jgi:serine/threonine protein kinase
MGLEVGRIRDVLEDPTAAERTPGLRSLQPGDPNALGRYVLLGRLGAGGMGTVYLAKAADPNGVERQVAVKMIRSELADDPAFLDRFAGEVAAARKVAGFCTARVLDAVLSPPDPYFVTEYIPGPPLDRAIREQGTLSGSELEALAVGMAAALVAIHAAGLVHRDLKPSNVLLSPYGPRVIDFGIARALPDGLARTEADTVFGTLAWTAPERLVGGKVGPAADVFSWGALIVYAATGRTPFGDGPPLQVADAIRTGTPDLRGLPPKLHRLVGAALAKDPAGRPTAQALLLDLCGPSGDTTQAATELVRSGWHYQPPPPPTPRRPAGPQGTRPLTRPMGAPPPGPPSQTTRYDRIAARYATPARPWYLRGWVWVLIAVVIAVLLGLIAGLAQRAEHRAQQGGSPPSTPSAAAHRSAAPAIRDAKDGVLDFQVTRVRCGGKVIGHGAVSKHASGQYCLVDLTVHNIGNHAAGVRPEAQKATDTAGDQHRADATAPLFLTSAEAVTKVLNPGQRTAGVLVFDVPAGATLTRLDVHDSWFSGGARLSLA